MALVIGFLYNLLVPRVGGISFDLVQVVQSKKESEPVSPKETSKKDEKSKKKWFYNRIHLYSF